MNRHKLAKATLIIVPLVTVLACGSGSGGDDEESTGKKGKGDGAAGEVGNWDIVNKPRFKKEFGSFAIVDLKIKNVSDDDDEPWLEIRLTDKKGDLVASFDCIGETVEPGQSTNLECISTDKYAPFTDYEIKNAI